MAMPESAHVRGGLGESNAFMAFQARLSRVARVNRPVLLAGERGTGKELAATRLHYLSKRWEGPLIALNCAALPSALIEAELFGHEAGSFTGALQSRRGRFEAADGGTLFLDEIATIPLEVQERILRAVEYGVFERVGNSLSIRVDVRIVAATNTDLRALVAAGRFKPDLLDRLSFEVLVLPALRTRQGDVLLLARHFAARMAFELERDEIPDFSPAAAAALTDYDWPGNVRELKNVVERAVYRTDEAVIDADALVFDPFASWTTAPGREADSGPAPSQPESATPAQPLTIAALATQPLDTALTNLERHLIREALHRCRYHQKRAAERLGLSYDQFRGRYRKHADSFTN